MSSPRPTYPLTVTTQMTLLHASVDALCACTVFMLVPQLDHTLAMVLFVLYNVLAFVTQSLVGLWLDRRVSRPSQLSASTCLLIAGGLLACTLQGGFAEGSSTLATVLVLLAVTLVGLGNSLFHVYGGIAVTRTSHNDMRHLGIFVSSGALGLLLGGQCAGIVTLVLLMAFMSGLTLLHRHSTLRHDAVSSASPLPSTSIQHHAGWFLTFIVLIVALRSFIGRLVPAEDASIPLYALWLTVLAFVGKSAGGFLGRRWGVWPVLTVTLLLTGLCFLLGYDNAGWLLGLTLCINLTMPLTLHLANHALPHRPGFAFGLLASVLAPGVGLAMLCSEQPDVTRLLYPLVATWIIEALVLLALGERRWQVQAMALGLNALTNISLNVLILYLLPAYPSLPVILLLEAAVFLIEAVGYRLVLHRWSTALRYSLLCNATSYLLGVGYSLLV